MKHPLFCTTFILSATLSFVAIFSVNHIQAQVKTTYNSTSYKLTPGLNVSVDLITSDGKKQTLSIPNQDPPSILQPITFDIGAETAKAWSDNHLLLVSTDPSWLLPGPPADPKASLLFTNLPIRIPGGSTSYQGLVNIGIGTKTKAEQIRDEDLVINSIDTSHKLTLEVPMTYGTNWNDRPHLMTMSAPATNCVKLSGNGPRKIVFMRGKSMNMTVSDFIVYTNQLIKEGFKETDPFKSSFDQFQFYVDLKNYDDASFPTHEKVLYSKKYTFYGYEVANGFEEDMKANSSCFEGSRKLPLKDDKGQFIFNFKSSKDLYQAWATNLESGFIYIKVDADELTSGYTSRLLMHEMGHSLAGLDDEYLFSDIATSAFDFSSNRKNCTLRPSRDFRSSIDNKVYGIVYTDKTIGSIGCSYLKSRFGTEYYRPSQNSIMNSQYSSTKFNVISCGYVMTAIKGEPINKEHAQKYWPECMNLNVVKGGVPPSLPAPVVEAVTPASGATKPNTFKASGSGFTPTENTVKLTPVKSGARAPMDHWLSFFIPQITLAQTQTTSTFYEITGIPSSDGKTLDFTVPTTTPDGTYRVSVGVFNSPWTETAYTIVVTGNGRGDVSTAIVTDQVQTVSVNQANPAETIISYSCPTGYTVSPDQKTCTTPGKITPASIVGYSCNGSLPAFFGPNSQGTQQCLCNNPTGYVPATTVYGCPVVAPRIDKGFCPKPVDTTSIGTLTTSGSEKVCVVPASTIASTATYSCQEGYTLSGTTCARTRFQKKITDVPTEETDSTTASSNTSFFSFLTNSIRNISNGVVKGAYSMLGITQKVSTGPSPTPKLNPVASPTITPTTKSVSQTPSPTSSVRATVTPSPTVSVRPTVMPKIMPTIMPTPTSSPVLMSPSPSISPKPSNTVTPSPIPTYSSIATPTSRTGSSYTTPLGVPPVPSSTPTPSQTPVIIPIIPSPTPSPTQSSLPSPTPSNSPSPSPSASPTSQAYQNSLAGVFEIFTRIINMVFGR